MFHGSKTISSFFMGKQNAAQHCTLRVERWESLSLSHFLAVRKNYTVPASAQSAHSAIAHWHSSKPECCAQCTHCTGSEGQYEAEHAAHIFKREFELDAATMFTDSASTRLDIAAQVSNKRGVKTNFATRRNCATVARFYYVRGIEV
jgi:hypothetical protein